MMKAFPDDPGTGCLVQLHGISTLQVMQYAVKSVLRIQEHLLLELVPSSNHIPDSPAASGTPPGGQRNSNLTLTRPISL
jgi:hypothetical protein